MNCVFVCEPRYWKFESMGEWVVKCLQKPKAPFDLVSNGKLQTLRVLWVHESVLHRKIPRGMVKVPRHPQICLGVEFVEVWVPRDNTILPRVEAARRSDTVSARPHKHSSVEISQVTAQTRLKLTCPRSTILVNLPKSCISWPPVATSIPWWT